MPLYTQTTSLTCGPAALMMALAKLSKLKLSKETEYKLWNETCLLPLCCADPYGLAIAAKRKGLNATVIRCTKKYKIPSVLPKFHSYIDAEIEEWVALRSKLYRREATSERVMIKDIDPSLKDIKGALLDGKLVIAQIDSRKMGGPSLHYILLTGYDSGSKKIIYNDPSRDKNRGGKRLRITEEKMMECCDTSSLGPVPCIVVIGGGK